MVLSDVNKVDAFQWISKYKVSDFGHSGIYFSFVVIIEGGNFHKPGIEFIEVFANALNAVDVMLSVDLLVVLYQAAVLIVQAK